MAELVTFLQSVSLRTLIMEGPRQANHWVSTTTKTLRSTSSTEHWNTLRTATRNKIQHFTPVHRHEAQKSVRETAQIHQCANVVDGDGRGLLWKRREDESVRSEAAEERYGQRCGEALGDTSFARPIRWRRCAPRRVCSSPAVSSPRRWRRPP
jgi:hypothetical protein